MTVSNDCRPSRLPTLLLASLGAVGTIEAGPAAAANRSVEFGGSYVSDLLTNISGGRRRGAALLGKLEATAEMDGSVIGLDGATGYVAVQFVHGRSLSSELVGDAQVASNIEAASALRPFEAWIEVPIADERLSAKFGLIDLNGEFDVQATGQLFLNSSHGIGPDFSQSGLNGPSIFPTTGPAAMLRYQAEGGAIRLGLFDAVPGDPEHPKRTRIRVPGKQGLLIVVEVDKSIGDRAKIQLGAWSYTARFDRIAPSGVSAQREFGNGGAYAMVEAKLAGNPGVGTSLDGWLRVGVAESEVNPIEVYWGGGLAYGSDDSRVGLALAHARLGKPAITAALADGARLKRAETNIELTYSGRITPWLTLQPDVQYVINPGWKRGLSNAFVAGVRVIFELP
jgi:porin